MITTAIIFFVFLIILFKYPELGKALWWAFILTILVLLLNACSCIPGL